MKGSTLLIGAVAVTVFAMIGSILILVLVIGAAVNTVNTCLPGSTTTGTGPGIDPGTGTSPLDPGNYAITGGISTPITGSITAATANIPTRSGTAGFRASMPRVLSHHPDFVALQEQFKRSIPLIESAAPGYTAYRDPHPDHGPGSSQAPDTVVMWRSDTWRQLDGGRVKLVNDDRARYHGHLVLWDRYASWALLEERQTGAIASIVSVHAPTNPAKFGPDKPHRKALFGHGMDVLNGLNAALATHGPVFIGGDFNVHPDELEPWSAPTKLRAAGFGWDSTTGVDFLFYPAGAGVTSNASWSGPMVSDHPWLAASFAMNGVGATAPPVSSTSTTSDHGQNRTGPHKPGQHKAGRQGAHSTRSSSRTRSSSSRSTTSAYSSSTPPAQATPTPQVKPAAYLTSRHPHAHSSSPRAPAGTRTPSTSPSTSSAQAAQDGPLPTVPGFTTEQVTDAAQIIAAGRALNVPDRGIAIGLMTALGESGLRVLDHGDVVGPDSRGLFQQRSTGWGTLADRLDPFVSATNFFRALLKVPGWAGLAPTLAAHAVQANADPNYYVAYWTRGLQLYSALAGTTAAMVADPSSVDCTAPTTDSLGATAISFTASGQAYVGPYPPAVLLARAKAFVGAGTGNPFFSMGHLPNWYRACQHFVANLSGRSSSGFNTAADGWAHFVATSAAHPATAPDGQSPPVGAWLYFSSPDSRAGHVAVYLGDNAIATTDLPIAGQVGIVPASAPITVWHQTYLGWVTPWAAPNTGSSGSARP